MRISTSTVFDSGLSALNRQQAQLFKTQQQIAAGRRILTPADDPIASSRVLELSQAQSSNTQYATNRGHAKSTLGILDSTLAAITDLLQDVRQQAVYGGDQALTGQDRGAIASDLRSRFDELLALANATDDRGEYLFSGYQASTRPFAQINGGASYVGDQGQRLAQVSGSRQIGISESGAALFELIRNGNGTFVTAAAAANTGSGTVAPGSVTNAALLTGDSYRLDFTVANGLTTYDIVDATTSLPVSTGNAYTANGAIAFDGMQFTIDGAPANGDQFTVVPAAQQSVFTTLEDIIAALGLSSGTPATNAHLANGISAGLRDLDQALGHILDVRASVGSRMKEVDSLDSAGQDLNLQYQQSRSLLQDLDYAAAITTLTQQQMTLEAAQKSFAQINRLSLFTYL